MLRVKTDVGRIYTNGVWCVAFLQRGRLAATSGNARVLVAMQGEDRRERVEATQSWDGVCLRSELTRSTKHY